MGIRLWAVLVFKLYMASIRNVRGYSSGVGDLTAVNTSARRLSPVSLSIQ